MFIIIEEDSTIKYTEDLDIAMEYYAVDTNLVVDTTDKTWLDGTGEWVELEEATSFEAPEEEEEVDQEMLDENDRQGEQNA